MKSDSIVEFLYRVSLEAPGRWFLILGPGQKTVPPYLDIWHLNAFVDGFANAQWAMGQPGDDGDRKFFDWLRDDAKVHTSRGWAAELFDRSKGDHQAAVHAFIRLLRDFAVTTKPKPDIRVAGAMVNGRTMATGVRHLQVGRSEREVAVSFVTEPPMSDDEAKWIPETPIGACTLIATLREVSFRCAGECGVAHVRNGRLKALALPNASKRRLSIRSGDRVLILTGAFLRLASRLPGKELPPGLSSGDAMGWASTRRVTTKGHVVAVAWPPHGAS